MTPSIGELYQRAHGVTWRVMQVDMFGVVYAVEGLHKVGAVSHHQWARLKLKRAVTPPK